jgi:hypothetical protein
MPAVCSRFVTQVTTRKWIPSCEFRAVKKSANRKALEFKYHCVRIFWSHSVSAISLDCVSPPRSTPRIWDYPATLRPRLKATGTETKSP